jgi:hypothetical protein
MFGVDSGYVYGNGSSGQILRIAKGTVIAP